jgi:hypothetical protein
MTSSIRSPIASTHGVGVLGDPGGIAVAGEIRRHDVLAPLAELGLYEVPVPADVARTWIRTNVLISEPP